ncbi:hypothetical protein LOD99_13109 [Oopsacas minuta]|uniref:DNA-directed RNA polymerase III subunit n=1 Tax=Oopsacas minuta TaxID=111878 RepID=A0AAV7JB07_9METZ|nr:hypothetical protein LOD99_13109 [Oopsacas minuta]
MFHRRNFNVYSNENIKVENEPEQLFSKFANAINQIDQYIHDEDRLCLRAKRELRKSMRYSSQYTYTRINTRIGLSNLEVRTGNRVVKRKTVEDFYLTGMPLELMMVNSKGKRKNIRKKNVKKVKKATKTGENEGSSEDEKGNKDKSDSGSEDEIYSNSSGVDEAGDYADTHFDNGEDNIASDNSGGEEDFY